MHNSSRNVLRERGDAGESIQRLREENVPLRRRIVIAGCGGAPPSDIYFAGIASGNPWTDSTLCIRSITDANRYGPVCTLVFRAGQEYVVTIGEDDVEIATTINC